MTILLSLRKFPGFEELCARHWGHRLNTFLIISQKQVSSCHSPAREFSVNPQYIQDKTRLLLFMGVLPALHTGQTAPSGLCAFSILSTLLKCLSSCFSIVQLQFLCWHPFWLLAQISSFGALVDHSPSPLSYSYNPTHTSAACPLRSVAMSDSSLCP